MEDMEEEQRMEPMEATPAWVDQHGDKSSFGFSKQELHVLYLLIFSMPFMLSFFRIYFSA